ncbi:MAG TPA: hypothetical protein VGZ47_02485 [Gemmataceae bacterium]|jgi:hypothetical protein|nr:hypothetical protein [Gemmataceae bacterium]
MSKYVSFTLFACICILMFPPAAPTAEPAASDADQAIVDLYKNGKLFDKMQYAKVRTAFANAFIQKHDDEIRKAFDKDYDELMAWLDKNVELKEELFTALLEERDDLTIAFRLLHDLWKKAPEAVAKYPNLAIAMALVWDQPKNIYNYVGHQVRTHSILPDTAKKQAPVDVFQFYIDHTKDIQGKETINRLQALPWEFLVYVVNHFTPAEERLWAIKQYVPKRAMIGRIYSDVQYDKEMLRTQSQVCKLDGKQYTLENIVKYGGVCAMQADFASRVGQSIGVPAAYVRGQSAGLEQHAWVMWVEVHNVTKGGKITFTLESHGRYFGDQYYTGTLHDPQTGEEILDRDMERRLGSVAKERDAKRQADLAMRAFPMLKEKLSLDRNKTVAFLDQVLKVSHYNEGVWQELVGLVRTGELSAESKSLVLTHLEALLKSYEAYPDFTWKIAPELVQINPDKAARNKIMERLATRFEIAGRPDLACQARLQWSELTCEQKQWKTAATGLSKTIDKFATEGRYVPKMMDKLQEVCEKYKGGIDFLAKFYLETLAKIPGRRGDEPNKYCIAMHEQALKFLQDNKKEKEATTVKQRLELVKGGRLP